ncbi:hypothetical protein QUC31_009767 [Theobroma cacao]
MDFTVRIALFLEVFGIGSKDQIDYLYVDSNFLPAKCLKDFQLKHNFVESKKLIIST